MATSSDKVIFDRDEWNLIVEFAGCSLDESPGKNWVENSGGLPEYICRIAKAIKRSGKTTSQAVSIAVSRVKKWASGADDVDADTRAKAAKAVAEWEKLKAKNKAKNVKASHGQNDIVMLTTTFNVDAVRRAWNKQTSEWRTKWSAMNPSAPYSAGPPYSYIKEMWTTFLIVEADGTDECFKVDYEVDDDGNVTFADPKPVRTEYVVIDETEAFGEQPSNTELRTMMATVGPCHPSNTEQVLLAHSATLTNLDQVLQQQIVRFTALEEVLSTSSTTFSALETVLRHAKE